MKLVAKFGDVGCSPVKVGYRVIAHPIDHGYTRYIGNRAVGSGLAHACGVVHIACLSNESVYIAAHAYPFWQRNAVVAKDGEHLPFVKSPCVARASKNCRRLCGSELNEIDFLHHGYQPSANIFTPVHRTINGIKIHRVAFSHEVDHE